ncbi:MAG: rod shape-determining protein MreC [Rhodospirillales bacterium]
MNDRQRVAHRIAQPVKSAAQRFAYVGLVIAAFALMIFGKYDTVVVERARTMLTDAVAPILTTVSRPVDSVSNFARKVEALWGLHAENERLREQNARLIQWQAVARKLEAENTALKGLLNFYDPGSVGYVTARVIADTGGAFAHSLLVNAGERAGVAKGQAVVTGEGLVGRIAGVGSRSARILLLTDLSSRIPVAVEPGRIRGILAGDNSDRPRLIRLPPSADLSPGDLVITSGHGGAFPVGLPVGVVASVTDAGITVQPFVDRATLEVVRVVDYGLAGILRREQIEERPVTAPMPETAGESPQPAPVSGTSP